MAKKKPESEKPTRTMELPVKLTPSELRERGQELAAAVERQRQAEETKKAQAKDAKVIVDACRTETLRLKDVVNNGAEPRNVPVLDRVDVERRTVLTIRLDTEPPETVSSRAMTATEVEAAQQGRLWVDADAADGEAP